MGRMTVFSFLMDDWDREDARQEVAMKVYLEASDVSPGRQRDL